MYAPGRLKRGISTTCSYVSARRARDHYTKVERIERVIEKFPNELIAEVVPADGHVSYENTRWLFTAEEAGTHISFTTEVEPDFWIPGFIGPNIIKGNLKRRVERTLDNLEEAARAYEQ